MGEGTKPTTSRAQSSHHQAPATDKAPGRLRGRADPARSPGGLRQDDARPGMAGAYQRPLAWYQASTASADVAALATGLAAELDAAVADGTTVTNDRMTSLAAFQQRPDVLARALHRSRETWPARLVVAIDDYHQLSGSDAAEAFVGELVSLLPATFVITTRTRPSWFSPRLSVYGEAVEVGTADLAMTENEARAGLRSVVAACASIHARARTRLAGRDRPCRDEPAERTSRRRHCRATSTSFWPRT